MGMHARYEVIVCKNLESASTDKDIYQQYPFKISSNEIKYKNEEMEIYLRA